MILNLRHCLRHDTTTLATCYQLAVEARDAISRGLADPDGKGSKPGKAVCYSECFIPSDPLFGPNYQLLNTHYRSSVLPNGSEITGETKWYLECGFRNRSSKRRNQSWDIWLLSWICHCQDVWPWTRLSLPISGCQFLQRKGEVRIGHSKFCLILNKEKCSFANMIMEGLMSVAGCAQGSCAWTKGPVIMSMWIQPWTLPQNPQALGKDNPSLASGFHLLVCSLSLAPAQNHHLSGNLRGHVSCCQMEG